MLLQSCQATLSFSPLPSPSLSSSTFSITGASLDLRAALPAAASVAGCTIALSCSGANSILSLAYFPGFLVTGTALSNSAHQSLVLTLEIRPLSFGSFFFFPRTRTSSPTSKPVRLYFFASVRLSFSATERSFAAALNSSTSASVRPRPGPSGASSSTPLVAGSLGSTVLLASPSL